MARGTEAIVRSVVPTAEVEFQDFAPGPVPVRLWVPGIAKQFLSRNGELQRWLGTYDLVIDTGSGDSFADIYGLKRLGLMSAIRELAVRAGVPVLMGPQTIGPFESRPGRVIARRSLKRVDAVLARDSVSLDVARGGFGVDAQLSTDVVFGIPVVAGEQPGRDIDVLFNVSGLLWHENPHVDHAAYREHCVRYCRAQLELGRRLVLLSHVLPSNLLDNDQPACREVAEALGRDVEVVVPSGLDDAREAISRAHVVVGARMHACLNALSLQVPAIAWAYSRKFEPLLADLGWQAVVDLRADHDVVGESLALTEQFLVAGDDAATKLKAGADSRLEVARTVIGQLCAK